ncbi:MAG: FAD-dependent oxidoreductase [Rhodobacteraceae bacterium]|nr:FAD-dependent oxidoreductase [Paracoccaceae bacterium]
MTQHYRVAVIGGGVVGTSVLYHLAKFGWHDSCLIERSVLAAGSSWHAAGGIHAFNADPNMAALQAYTIDLLTEIERESGQSIGLNMTGGVTIACQPDRWDSLKSSYRIYQTMGIDDCRLMTPAEVKEACPIMRTEDVLGGLWADREGFVDTTGTVNAYAVAARKRGATVLEHNRVIELELLPGPKWRLITEQGNIVADHVINAAGLWAKRVGRMVGVELPLSPLKHHYLITDTVPQLVGSDARLPMGVDPEGFTYMRQDQLGILVGIYETNPSHWCIEGAPWDYGMELFEEDTERLADELDMAFHRYPVLEDVGVKTWVHGAFTFSPDGNPLVGPVRNLPNYWLACGVMAGFLQGGGVGKTLAEWMIRGESEVDAWSMDIARYGDFTSNIEYIRQTTGQFYSRRFVLQYPNEQLWAGRPLKMSPAYRDLSDSGANWGESWGLEVPLFFAPKGFEETPSLRRSNAFRIVAEECKAARDQAGILDIAGYSRFRVTGSGARKWLDHLLAGKLPPAGRSRLAPMLAVSGRLKGDLMVLNWDGGEWWIMGSYYLRQWHMRWFEEFAEDGVLVEDISDSIVGFAVVGNNSRQLVEAAAGQAISNDRLPFMAITEMDIGLLRARVARISVTGELGYEINCHASDHAALYRTLKQAGEGLNARDIGFYALNSLRLEKSFGVWSAEYRQEYDPIETGLDRWIDDGKRRFVGRDAYLRRKEQGSERRLVTLELDARDADAVGYEPVRAGSEIVGFVTSGCYGHYVGKSLAMALVSREVSAPGTALSTHILGTKVRARVIERSPHDPNGDRMRQ